MKHKFVENTSKKDLVEVNFIQDQSENRIYVTSNPNFAFHDDVFPEFAKNAAFQLQFPKSSRSMTSPHPKTIIPDEFFRSFEHFRHISSVEFKFDGSERFKFEINFQEMRSIKADQNIIKLQFYDKTTFLSLGYFKNGSIWAFSDYITTRIILNSTLSESNNFELRLHTNETTTVEIIAHNTREKFEVSGVNNRQNRRIRIWKEDHNVEIKNFIYYPAEQTQISAILPSLFFTSEVFQSYALLSDGEIIRKNIFNAPKFLEAKLKEYENKYHASLYTTGSKHAILSDKLHIFGGFFNCRKV